MAKTNAAHILIETIVRQTIKGIKENPERGIRRLVDMAQEFSGGGTVPEVFLHDCTGDACG